MRDPEAVTIETTRFTIEGRSRAGNETWFRIRQLGIALDIGRCPDQLVSVPHIFISHAHLDHALGIPFYAAQRSLLGMEAGTVYVPGSNVEDYGRLMEIHHKLENTRYPMNLRGLDPGDEVGLRKDLRVRTHESTHRVSANSYEVLERRHKLREELRGSSAGDLVAARAAGSEVHDWSEVSLLFYTGDTDRRILESSDALFRSQVLMIECSFTGEGDQDRASKYTHIHFDDLLEHSGRFENEWIVLTHFSLRDTPEEIQRSIARRCTPDLRPRIRLALPPPYDRV